MITDTVAHSFWVFWIFNNALLLTVIFSFIVERYLKPQRPRLNVKTVILQSLIVTLLFLAVTLIVQRPIFAALAVSIFLIILTGVSNAKFIALKEPMVFSDITMFSQAFRHPRLYFPFLGLLPVIAMPLVIIGLIYAVLTLEPALQITWHRMLMTLTAMLVCIVAAKSIAKGLKISQDPASDNRDFGLLNSLLAYAVQARSEQHQSYIKSALDKSPFAIAISEVKTNGTTAEIDSKIPVLSKVEATPHHFIGISLEQALQNITVVQSESFFDARRLDSSINSDVLKYYDDCLSESALYGKLKVPAWGANTMRTEFSFLTGLKYEEMGLYRYYPYQYLHKMPIVSLAKLLQSQGYHCVCIHPHPASFFGRDRIFPPMGFDEFIDIKSFDTTHTFGPYISDQAVTDKILEVNNKYNHKPLFIFAITMENHGPLHLEKTTREEQQSYFSKPPIDKINDLTVYLRHLKNADNMVDKLTTEYRKDVKPHTICFYGDHIPSMPKIYKELAYEDRDSDYFIWNNRPEEKSHPTEVPNEKHKNNKPVDISVNSLAETLLKQTGNIRNL